MCYGDIIRRALLHGRWACRCVEELGSAAARCCAECKRVSWVIAAAANCISMLVCVEKLNRKLSIVWVGWCERVADLLVQQGTA